MAILLTTSATDAAALSSVPAGQVTALQCATIEDAIAFANDFAPEHLSLACRDPARWLPGVRSAGSVFLGPYGAPAAGDYATGANHVLPTGGSARSFGALGVSAFGRAIQVQQVEANGIEAVASVVDILAAVERLPWHAASVRLRFDR
jgi:histidinol dehydrogenase